MCERKGSQDDNVRADGECVPRIQSAQVVAVTRLVSRRYKSIAPSASKPARQRIQHTGRKGNNLFRQFGAVQKALDRRCMGPVRGDIEWDKVREVDCVYYT